MDQILSQGSSWLADSPGLRSTKRGAGRSAAVPAESKTLDKDTRATPLVQGSLQKLGCSWAVPLKTGKPTNNRVPKKKRPTQQTLSGKRGSFFSSSSLDQKRSGAFWMEPGRFFCGLSSVRLQRIQLFPPLSRAPAKLWEREMPRFFRDTKRRNVTPEIRRPAGKLSSSRRKLKGGYPFERSSHTWVPLFPDSSEGKSQVNGKSRHRLLSKSSQAPYNQPSKREVTRLFAFVVVFFLGGGGSQFLTSEWMAQNPNLLLSTTNLGVDSLSILFSPSFQTPIAISPGFLVVF